MTLVLSVSSSWSTNKSIPFLMKRFFWVWRRLCWDWLGRRVLRGLWDCWGVGDRMGMGYLNGWFTGWKWWPFWMIGWGFSRFSSIGFIGLLTCCPKPQVLRCSNLSQMWGFSHGFVGPLGPWTLGSVNHCWETSIGFQQEKSVFRPPKHEDPTLSHWKSHSEFFPPHCNVMKQDGGVVTTNDVG